MRGPFSIFRRHQRRRYGPRLSPRIKARGLKTYGSASFHALRIDNADGEELARNREPCSPAVAVIASIHRGPLSGRYGTRNDEFTRWLGREGQETLVRGQDVGLHVILDHRLAVERLHRTDQRHPVQHLVLPGELHLGQ